MPTRKAKIPDIKNLYYITHVDNIPSMLSRGILSHSAIAQGGIPYTPIYDEQIVSNRKDKSTPDGSGLWEYANVYFQPRNPMMYRVVHEKGPANLAVVAVRPQILQQSGSFVTNGNAASGPTEFFEARFGVERIADQWSIIQSEWWRSDDGSKRKIMAECLVPLRIPPELIDSVYVAGSDEAQRIRVDCDARRVPVIIEPQMFFQPRRAHRVGRKISLVQGDMFFSNMQTLTVSVNTVGIMGKGLASRAKYQFPDVYVTYQDACRSRKLTPSRPYLYKREASLDEELAEPGTPLANVNSVKWFLLFATKRHWRDDSRIDDIEAGLTWLQRNAIDEGIESLALPALGCGLGGLQWKDVGPLMCKMLNPLGIDIAIYLPHEGQLEAEYLTEMFLLGTLKG